MNTASAKQEVNLKESITKINSKNSSLRLNKTQGKCYQRRAKYGEITNPQRL